MSLLTKPTWTREEMLDLTESSVGFDGQSCRASLSAEDTRGHAFPVAAAQAWNSLPSHVTSSLSLVSFKRNLKTELFLRSYVQA